MKKNVFLSLLFVSFVLGIALNSCKKDETITLSLVSIAAGTIDLNGATAPNNVPVNPSITATFSTEVDQTTANANITLLQDYDQANIPLTITVTGSTVTIAPTGKLGNGALYKLSFGAGLKATNGTLLTALNRTFTTIGTFTPAGQVAHWNFENNANDQVGSFSPATSGIVAISYTDSRNTAAGKAATFDGATSIIEIPNGDQLMSQNFTLAFWVKASSASKTSGHFVMGLGAFYGFQFEIAGDYTNCKLAASYNYTGGADSTIATDLWWNGDGKTKDNGGWRGTTFNKDLTGSGGVQGILKDKWAHIVCTYNSATKVGTMYMNGEKMKAQDFNLWPTTDRWVRAIGLKYGGKMPDVKNELAFGFIQSRAGTMWATEPWGGYSIPTSNHFKGQLDDVRVFNKSLSDNEVTLMYNSEK